MKIIPLIFAVVAYMLFNGAFIYLSGFLGNYHMPKSIDSPGHVDLWHAMLVNVLFMLIFALHHSLAARPKFKTWLQRWVPSYLERSIYVFTASLLLIAIMVHWQSVPGLLWRVESVLGTWVIYGVFAAGLLFSFAATFLTDHYELFGLRQPYNHLTGKSASPQEFREASLYKWVRHPIMLGTLVALWATPVMTGSHLLFATFMSLYIFVGMHFEERDLVNTHGQAYVAYRQRTPMILPFF